VLVWIVLLLHYEPTKIVLSCLSLKKSAIFTLCRAIYQGILRSFLSNKTISWQIFENWIEEGRDCHNNSIMCNKLIKRNKNVIYKDYLKVFLQLRFKYDIFSIKEGNQKKKRNKLKAHNISTAPERRDKVWNEVSFNVTNVVFSKCYKSLVFFF